MTKTPAQLVAAYERGLLTRMDATIRLMEAAADRPPEEVAAELPADWLAFLREECEERWPCPPVEQILILRLGSWIGPAEEYERARREEARRWHAGLQAWQAFFGISCVEPADGRG